MMLERQLPRQGRRCCDGDVASDGGVAGEGAPPRGSEATHLRCSRVPRSVTMCQRPPRHDLTPCAARFGGGDGILGRE